MLLLVLVILVLVIFDGGAGRSRWGWIAWSPLLMVLGILIIYLLTSTYRF